MENRELVILRYTHRAPSLAECGQCHVKFFTPSDLIRLPDLATEYLRDKFERHVCSPIYSAQAVHGRK